MIVGGNSGSTLGFMDSEVSNNQVFYFEIIKADSVIIKGGSIYNNKKFSFSSFSHRFNIGGISIYNNSGSELLSISSSYMNILLLCI